MHENPVKKSDSRGSIHEANLRGSAGAQKDDSFDKKKDKAAKDELKKQESKSSIFSQPKKRRQSLSVGSLDKERITNITKKKEQNQNQRATMGK